MRKCHRKRRRRAFIERALPEFTRQLRQQLLASLPGGLWTLLQDTQDVENESRPVDAVWPVAWRL